MKERNEVRCAKSDAREILTSSFLHHDWLAEEKSFGWKPDRELQHRVEYTMLMMISRTKIKHENTPQNFHDKPQLIYLGLVLVEFCVCMISGCNLFCGPVTSR